MGKTYNKPYLKQYRKKLRNNPTQSEIIFWNKIKNKQLNGFKFRRQQSIGKVIVDFYCPKLKLAVEIDGITHWEEGIFDKDIEKQQYLEGLGIKVVRYNTERIFNDLFWVMEDLYNCCVELAGDPTP